MKRLPARVLAPADVRRLLDHTERHRHHLRNNAIVVLSFRAGLRACEIAGLTWPMALKTDGRIAEQLTVSKHIAKYGSGREIPIHADLKAALKLYHRSLGSPRDGPLILSERGGHMTPRSIVNWFHDSYAELGLRGCSSHSGRRTFITQSARMVSKTGGSLRDVQELAGHRALTTTERYIEGNRDAQRKLISLL
ncbi:tyrosine-type recombinase/integrase [Sphingobium sp. RAC03]|uniref:tyrosine-type recombinase/integrase n=1 Tax=Sphingobium sp. RAC03 TaxID=1843368 RepID=UPI00083E1F02|nr:site-specific integrase [Sphingobium sp. RAC03]AOF96372.1 phage integrase family protein [Sphingobium sp. RAC03]